MAVAIDELLISTADVEIQATGKPPAVNIVAYTGGLMTVPGWGPVAIDLGGIDASAEQVSLLADHDASLKGIVGHGQASVSEGKLLVQGTIAPSTEAARQVIDLARSGFRFLASVGVSPTEYDRVRAGDVIAVNGRTIKAPASGFTLLRASVLREVSIVALGAERDTSVSISAASRKECSMSTSETTELTAEEIRAAALAETSRIQLIRQACGDRYSDIAATSIRDGWDGSQAELAVLRASRPNVTTLVRGREVTSQTVLEAAILAHMGCERLAERQLGAEVAQQARDMRATNLVDLCRAALRFEGRDAPQGRDAMIRAALSTYALPTALGDAANKVLLEAYTESPATWRAFAGIRSASNFKDHTGVHTSDGGELEQLAAGGEIKHGTIKEATYKYSVDTFAKMLSTVATSSTTTWRCLTRLPARWDERRCGRCQIWSTRF